jgi:GT2 family glycosyltransferase
VPEAEVIHHEGQSTGQIREDSFVNLWCSRRRLYDKHYGAVKHWLALRLARAGMKRKLREAEGEGGSQAVESRLRAYRGALACFD